MSISVSIEEAVRRYAADLEERQCSVSHVATVRHRLGRFARGREGVLLRAVTGGELHGYFVAMQEAGLASGTLAGHKQTLLAFWRWCVGRRWCSSKPMEALRSRKHRYSFRPVRSRSAPAEDFAAVVAALPGFAAHRGWRARDVRDAALVSLVADSSRRRGEVWNLRRVDAARALEHPEPLGGGRSVYHVESHGKTGPVSIRFYDESAGLLRRWLELLPAGAVHVFVSVRSGERLRPDALHLGLLRICEFAGVPPFRFHAIRKRVVTEVISATGDYKVGQLLAGHTDERTTQMYYNDVQQAAVDVAAGALAAKYRGGGGDLAEAFFRRI